MTAKWRSISGATLLKFVAGKTVATAEDSNMGFGETTLYFTDGSAIRCSALEGCRYSSYSEDSPTVEWEACNHV